MASVSRRRRFLSIAASVAITLGGAWLASQVPALTSPKVEPHQTGEGLAVTLTGLRSASGQVVVLVFEDRQAFNRFDYRGAVGYRARAAVAGSLEINFPDLKAGPYAVTVFHDEDGDGDLTMAGQLPTEGYATSGALDAYDTPTFRQAAVARGSLRLNLNYLE